MSLQDTRKQPSIFPKLFIGDAYKSFLRYIEKRSLPYLVNYIQSREELTELIDQFSHYKNYSEPVIIADVSYFSHADQSLLLKFIDDTKLNIVLLASRDNILGTIISRVKEFRKFYVTSNVVNFLNINKARDLRAEELCNDRDISYEDMLTVSNKYNPLLVYNDSLVSKYKAGERDKLISLLEYCDER